MANSLALNLCLYISSRHADPECSRDFFIFLFYQRCAWHCSVASSQPLDSRRKCEACFPDFPLRLPSAVTTDDVFSHFVDFLGESSEVGFIYKVLLTSAFVPGWIAAEETNDRGKKKKWQKCITKRTMEGRACVERSDVGPQQLSYVDACQCCGDIKSVNAVNLARLD